MLENNKGFTLVELILAIFLILFVMSLGVFTYGSLTGKNVNGVVVCRGNYKYMKSLGKYTQIISDTGTGIKCKE
jgi:prepilin-type N-terminal cleavage/methylation domain-containing protein